MSEAAENSEAVGIDVKKTPEIEKRSLDAILIFGQGPVIEKETREKAGVINKGPGSEDVNFWSKSLAQAAAELYKRGETREIIIMGGKTGGNEYLSESDLIAKELIESYGVPENAIRREQRSTNTLENIINILNDYVDSTDQYQKIGILGSNFHIPRIKLLMQEFEIPFKEAFSAEEVIRYVAGAGRPVEEWDRKTLLEIERKLDMDEAQKKPIPSDYYQGKQGEERMNIAKKGQNEDVWSMALLDVPEYWLGYLGKLNNSNRIRQILAKQNQQVLKEKFGIDLSGTDETIRNKLLSIKRIVPNQNELAGKKWPPETVQKLEDFVNKR